jgi:hypothetical protein
MAILKVNADNRGQDVLSSFMPFVADRLYHSTAESLSVSEIRESVLEEYGLALPEAVVHTLVRKCAHEGLVKREQRRVFPDRNKLASSDLATARSAARRNQAALVQAGVRYAKETFGVVIEGNAFETALHSFIQANTAPLLSTVIDGRPLVAPPQEGETGDTSLLVAAFISQVAEADPVAFEQLAAVVKGATLASALYFPDPSTLDRRLDGLDIYLDTTLLLRAAGACGSEMQTLTREFLALAVRRGAKLAAFTHTIKEVRGVLGACAMAVKRPTGDYFGEATEFMISAGWGYSDVVSFEESLEDKLAELGVQVRDAPEYVESLTLDEKRLDEILERVVGNREGARRKDVRSISAIFTLRKGRQVHALGKSKAIFATSNGAVVSAAREYSRLEDFDRESIPLATTDHMLATVLWLTQQIQAPDLPIRTLVADSYAAMRVDEATWRQYVRKIDALKTSGDISDEEYALLRQSLQVRSMVVFETQHHPSNFTGADAQKVLAVAKAEITAKADAEAADARAGEKRASAELENLRATTHTRDEVDALVRAAEESRMDRASERVARGIAVVLLAIPGLMAVVGGFFTIPAAADSRPAGVVGAVVSVCIVVAVVLGIVSVLTEKGLPWLHKWLVGRLKSRVRRVLFGAASAPTR